MAVVKSFLFQPFKDDPCPEPTNGMTIGVIHLEWNCPLSLLSLLSLLLLAQAAGESRCFHAQNDTHAGVRWLQQILTYQI